MKVIYQDSVVKRVQAAVYEAGKANRRIERIDLTIAEANEVSAEMQRSLFISDGTMFLYYTSKSHGAFIGQLFGAKLYVEPAL
jgi:hypothetical protein